MDAFRGDTRSWELSDAPSIVASLPAGNDGIARHVIKQLILAAFGGAERFNDIMTGAIRFRALDRDGAPVRLRLGATVVQCPQRTSGAHPVTVTCTRNGRLERVDATCAVLAGGWSALHAVRDLPEADSVGIRSCVRAPLLLLTVTLRQWRFLYEPGITGPRYDAVAGRDTICYTASVRQPLSIGTMRQPLNPDRPILLTMCVPFLSPGKSLREQVTAGRVELLGAPFHELERRVRATLSALVARTGFDAARHIAGPVCNCGGHANVCPAPGFCTGRNGVPAPSPVLREPVERIGNAERNGYPNLPARSPRSVARCEGCSSSRITRAASSLVHSTRSRRARRPHRLDDARHPANRSAAVAQTRRTPHHGDVRGHDDLVAGAHRLRARAQRRGGRCGAS